MEHDRISLKDAATKQTAELQELTEECKAVYTVMLESIHSIKKAQQDLGTAQQAAQKSLQEVKRNCHRQLDQMFNKHDKEINTVAMEREQKIKTTLDSLEKGSEELQEAQANASKLIACESEFEISHKYASTSEKLKQLAKSEPETIDDSLGYMTFETLAPMILPTGKVSKQEKWQYVRQFSTEGHLEELWHIAVNNSDIAISSRSGKIKVFSNTGEMKYTLQESGYSSISVSPDGRYITLDDVIMFHFDSMGRLLSTIPHSIPKPKATVVADTDPPKTTLVTATDPPKSTLVTATDPPKVTLVTDTDPPKATVVTDTDPPKAIVVTDTDPTGLNILGWEDSKISIHYAEGSLKSQFQTQSEPYNLATTSKREIAVSFDHSLQLMDYSGGNTREIQGPPDIDEWDPGFVCCSPFKEIFVINEGGDGHIYKFDEDGNYLGIVTTEVENARGLALSQDGNELFVTEQENKLVVVFQRM